MERRRLWGSLTIVAAAACLAFAPGGGAAGATTGTLSLDVATFAHHDSQTTHDDICGAPYVGNDAFEYRGTMNGAGGYLGSVNLGQGSTITAFRLVVRDNDVDIDVYAYLVRKRMAPSAVPVDGFQGYKTLASVKSSGASSNLRRFATAAIANARVDNAKYAYFVELVSCADTVDPIGVQVAWRHS